MLAALCARLLQLLQRRGEHRRAPIVAVVARAPAEKRQGRMRKLEFVRRAWVRGTQVGRKASGSTMACRGVSAGSRGVSVLVAGRGGAPSTAAWFVARVARDRAPPAQRPPRHRRARRRCGAGPQRPLPVLGPLVRLGSRSRARRPFTAILVGAMDRSASSSVTLAQRCARPGPVSVPPYRPASPSVAGPSIQPRRVLPLAAQVAVASQSRLSRWLAAMGFPRVAARTVR